MDLERWWYIVPIRLRAIFRPNTVEQELDDELRFHLDLQTEANLARGLEPGPARQAALSALGNLEGRKEECRGARGSIRVENLVADLRYALRGIRRSPGFAAVAIATIALGIGANSALLSVANAMLFRRLPVHAPAELFLLAETDGQRARNRMSYQVYDYLRQSSAFSGVIATSVEKSVLLAPTYAEFINVEIVTGNYFETLGVHPQLGRTIETDDDRLPGVRPVAVLSQSFWSRHFGADPKAIGANVALAGGTFQVIGVLPAGFTGLEIDEPTDIWVPFMMTEQVRPGFQPWKPLPRSNWLHLVGRLGTGVSQAGGEAAATLAYRQWQASAAGNQPGGGNAPGRARIALLLALKGFSTIRAQFSEPLFILTGAVGFVLLVATINVASMLLARSAARKKEIATRLALGSSAGRLAQQFLIEGLLLALFGGIAGLVLAFALAPPLFRLLIGPGPSPIDVLPDLNVIGLTLAVSALTGILFSLGPALSAAKPNVSVALRGEASGVVVASKRFSWRGLVATAQIAISLLILIAAGLFVRTLRNLHSVELGFAPKNVWLLEFYPHLSGYNEQESQRFFQKLVDGLGHSPGVNSVSYANLYSFNGLSEQTSVESDGGTAGEAVEVETSYVGPGYFKTLGVPILRGREFNAPECAAAEKKVAIISQSLARQLFGEADPIGHVIHRPPYAQTVVGVSADVKYNSLRESSPGILFTPGIWGYTTVIARTQTAAATLPGMIRREVERIDKRVPIHRISTLQEQVERSLQTERLLASLLGIFGALVALLSGVGVYGVVSYAVNSRTAEFGIRMALGATPAEILWLVLRGALRNVPAAIVVGVPISLALSRFLSHMLFGLSPADPWATGAAVVLIAGAVLIASLAPAACAARLDAVEALRRG